MQYQDQTLTCRDCGQSFVFTARDQQFFADKGFTNPPTRCRDCRLKKKEAGSRPGGSGTMADKPLFKITCKNCGKAGEMAIEPRKPNDVLCSECFYTDFKQELEKKGLAPKKSEEESEPESEEEPATA